MWGNLNWFTMTNAEGHPGAVYYILGATCMSDTAFQQGWEFSCIAGDSDICNIAFHMGLFHLPVCQVFFPSSPDNDTVSMLHKEERGIGKTIPDAPDFLRPDRFPKGEARGKSRGQRGWISQYLPRFGGVRAFSHHQFVYREWIRKSFPVMMMMMMREWFIPHTLIITDNPKCIYVVLWQNVCHR